MFFLLPRLLVHRTSLLLHKRFNHYQDYSLHRFLVTERVAVPRKSMSINCRGAPLQPRKCERPDRGQGLHGPGNLLHISTRHALVMQFRVTGHHRGPSAPVFGQLKNTRGKDALKTKWLDVKYVIAHWIGWLRALHNKNDDGWRMRSGCYIRLSRLSR